MSNKNSPKKPALEVAPFIQTSYAEISVNGIDFREDIPFDAYEKIGEQLGVYQRVSMFLLGDWINFGAKKFGDKYTEACAKTGLDEGTLRVAAYVARRVDLLRRRNKLSFEHHRVVAKIKEPEDQERWLDSAETHMLSTRLLIASIKEGEVLTPTDIQKKREQSDRERGTKNIYAALVTLLGMTSALEDSKGMADTWSGGEKSQLRQQFIPLRDFMKRLGFDFV